MEHILYKSRHRLTVSGEKHYIVISRLHYTSFFFVNRRHIMRVVLYVMVGGSKNI